MREGGLVGGASEEMNVKAACVWSVLRLGGGMGL